MGGFFGTVLKKDCVTDLFYGTDYNSHLGTKRGGMATYDPEAGFARSIHSLENSYFRSKFESVLPRFKGNMGIGIISDNDSQPIVVNSKVGKFAIVTVAKIANMETLEREMLESGTHFAELSSGKTNPTELIATIITSGKDITDGILKVQERLKGSCSLLLLTPDGIIAARDRLGRTPIVIGHKDEGYALTSETCALPNLGYDVLRDIRPGEIALITPTEVKTLHPGNPDKMQICSFLWVYYGFPVSTYEGINVESVRFASGMLMGRKDDTEIDCVCAKMKLIPNRSMLQDRKVAFCDDSIVRGTQLHDNVKMLYEYGAKEVHIRIACPPLIYGCPFIGFTSSKSDMELITRRVIQELEGSADKDLDKYATTGTPQYNAMVARIAEKFGLDSLKFSTIEDLVEAIGLPKCKVCTHCFDGSSYS